MTETPIIYGKFISINDLSYINMDHIVNIYVEEDGEKDVFWVQIVDRNEEGYRFDKDFETEEEALDFLKYILQKFE